MLRRLRDDDPQAVLDQVVAGEQVHAIASDADLRRRLADDRRIYALVDEESPDELLAFVEVALTRGLAGSMPRILGGPIDVTASVEADTATFYSINSCPPASGRRGVGRALLAELLPHLTVAHPQLTTFATLSPLPGFRRWLTGRDPSLATSLPDDVEGLRALAQAPPALWSAARAYLTTPDEDRRLPDPVGNFHVGNGASVARQWWGADPSTSGLERSWGVMVTYRYVPELLAERSRSYRERGEVTVEDALDQSSVAASSD